MASSSAIRASRAFVELFADTTKLQQGLRHAEGVLKEFATRATTIGRNMTAASGIMLAPLAMSMKTFTAFDDNMRETQAVTQATTVEFDKLAAKAKELGKSTSFTAIQVTQAMATLGRAGFKAGQINDAIDSVLNLARATRTDLNEAARIASMTMRGFVMESTDMSHIADVLSVTSNSAALNLQDLGESMKYVAPVAAQAGLSLEDAAGAIAIFSNYGIRGSMAGTGLKNILARMASPEVRQKFEAIGVSVVDASGNMRRFIDIMRDVGNATKDLGSGEKLGLFRELADLRALPSFAVAAGNPEKIVEIVDNLEQSFGKAAKTAAMMDAGIGGSFRFLISALEGTRLALADSIQAPLKKAMDTLRDYINAFSDWVKFNGKTISVYSKTALLLLGLGGIIYGVGKAVKVLAGGFTLARGAVKGFNGIIGLAANALKEYSGVAALTQKADAAKAALTEKQRAFGVATQAASLASTRLADAQRDVNFMQRNGITSTVEYLRAVDKLNVAQTAHEAATRRVALAKEQLAKAQADATAATLAAQKNGGGNKAIFLGAYHRLGGPITNMSNLDAGYKVLGELANSFKYVGKEAMLAGQKISTVFMRVTDKVLGPLVYRLTYIGTIMREKFSAAFAALVARAEVVANKIDAVWNRLAQRVAAAWDGSILQRSFYTIQTAADSVASGVVALWQSTARSATRAWQRPRTWFNTFVKSMGNNYRVANVLMSAITQKTMMEIRQYTRRTIDAVVDLWHRAPQIMRAEFGRFANWVNSILQTVSAKFQTASTAMSAYLRNPLQTMRILTTAASNRVRDVWRTASQAVSNAWANSTLKTHWTTIQYAAGDAALKVQSMWSASANAVSNAWSKTVRWFDTFTKTVKNSARVAGFVSSIIIQAIKISPVEAIKLLYQDVTKLMLRFATTIGQTWGNVASRFSQVWNGVLTSLRMSFQDVQAKVVGYLYDVLSSPVAKMASAAQTAAQAFSSAWGKAINFLKTGFTGLRKVFNTETLTAGLRKSLDGIKSLSFKGVTAAVKGVGIAAKASAVGVNLLKVSLGAIASFGGQIAGMVATMTLMNNLFKTFSFNLTVDVPTVEAENGEKIQRNNKTLLEYMENLQKLARASETEPLDHDAFDHAKFLIDTLNDSVKGLGLSYDELKGSISVASDAQEKLNENLKQQTVDNLMKQMREKQDALYELQDKRNRYMAANGWQALAFGFNEDSRMAWSKFFHGINPMSEDYNPKTGRRYWQDNDKLRASREQEAKLQSEYDELLRQYNEKTKTDVKEGEDISAAIERTIKRNSGYEPVAFKENEVNLDNIVSGIMSTMETAKSPADKINDLRKQSADNAKALKDEIDKIDAEAEDFLDDKNDVGVYGDLGLLNNPQVGLGDWFRELNRQYKEGTPESMRTFLEEGREKIQGLEAELTKNFRHGLVSESEYETTIQALHRWDSLLPQFEKRYELYKAYGNVGTALEKQISEISDEQLKNMKEFIKPEDQDGRMAELKKSKEEYEKQLANIDVVAKTLQKTGEVISFGDLQADGSDVEVLKEILKAIRDQTDAEINKRYDDQYAETAASAMKNAGASYLDIARVAYQENVGDIKEQADVTEYENTIAQANQMHAAGQISEQERDMSVYNALLKERNALLESGDLAYLGKKLEEAQKSFDDAQEEFSQEQNDTNAKALEEAANALNDMTNKYEEVFNNIIGPIDEVMADLMNKTYDEQQEMKDAGDERARVEYSSRGTFSAYEGSAVGGSTMDVKIEENTRRTVQTLRETFDWWRREYTPNEGAVFS